jgi:hypothetical protein
VKAAKAGYHGAQNAQVNADLDALLMFEKFASTVELLQSNFYTLTFEPGAAKG